MKYTIHTHSLAIAIFHLHCTRLTICSTTARWPVLVSLFLQLQQGKKKIYIGLPGSHPVVENPYHHHGPTLRECSIIVPSSSSSQMCTAHHVLEQLNDLTLELLAHESRHNLWPTSETRLLHTVSLCILMKQLQQLLHLNWLCCTTTYGWLVVRKSHASIGKRALTPDSR